MSRVETLRCYGCPLQPFHSRAVWQLIGLTNFTDARLDYTRYRGFTDVSIERKLHGRAIEAGEARGWGFYELQAIDPTRGGATRAEVDALRLMAVFLHHWDNKAANQRLICPHSASGDCRHPLAMIQDVGSAFGPRKVDLRSWMSRPVWASGTDCTVSMKWMPYKGGTFADVEISEGGRRLLGDRLSQLTRSQIEELFAGAGFNAVPAWAAAFQDKVRQIVQRPPCPGDPD